MTSNEWNSARWLCVHQGIWKCHLFDETFSNSVKLTVFLIIMKRSNLQTTFSRNITFRSPVKQHQRDPSPLDCPQNERKDFVLIFMMAHRGCLKFLISDEILTRKIELQGTEGFYLKAVPFIHRDTIQGIKISTSTKSQSNSYLIKSFSLFCSLPMTYIEINFNTYIIPNNFGFLFVHLHGRAVCMKLE